MRLKHKIHSSKWDENDHKHICIAARLLSKSDFKDVCPVRGKCDIEWSDCCDLCKYMKILNFRQDGKNRIIILE